jgi:hypothetical protein
MKAEEVRCVQNTVWVAVPGKPLDGKNQREYRLLAASLK